MQRLTRSRAVLGLVLVLLGLSGALVWRAATDRAPDLAGFRTVCRPSAPEVAVAAAGAPAALFHGNSLVHDHDWRLDGVLAVNCARQGLTAAAALGTAEDLPDISPVLVVLGFGSVEATRAHAAGLPLNVAGFLETATTLTAVLAARWPDATILWLPVPETTTSRLDPAEAASLNAGLDALAGAGLRIVFAGDNGRGSDVLRPALYDGLHLASDAYPAWETLIARTLVEIR